MKKVFVLSVLILFIGIEFVNAVLGSHSYAVVFTYFNQSMDEEKIDLICESNDSESLPSISNWFEKEAKKYNITNFHPKFQCFKNSIEIPEELKGKKFCGPEGCINQPIDTLKTPNYLREKLPELNNFETIIIIHYYSSYYQFYNVMEDKNVYIFTYPIPNPNFTNPHIPFGLLGYGGTSIAHEISHVLGATDKYSYYLSPVENWTCCTTDPLTNKEYSGHDIMCHKIKSGEGCNHPKFEELEITKPTAREIGWLEVCSDECTIINKKECVNRNSYRVCKNYDEDECLEWTNLIRCKEDEICKKGICIKERLLRRIFNWFKRLFSI